MTEHHQECEQYRFCSECPRGDLCEAEEQAEKLLADEKAQEDLVDSRLAILEGQVSALWSHHRELQEYVEKMVAAVVRAAQDEER